jgi:uncharacterized protein (TIGR03792 family)
MVIEWQRFRVRPDTRDRFLASDAEIWTAGLAREAGFLGKEVWAGDEEDDDVILVIRWRSEEEWKAIPPERLADLEKRFRREVPEGYEIMESLIFRPVGPVAGHG